MKLKHYQENTLNCILEFLKMCRYSTPEDAFKKLQDADGYPVDYKPLKGLDNVPYICTRVPTGGGKTLMAAYTVGIAADSYLEIEHPVVLWLVPTDVIRQQTLSSLKNKQHANYLALQNRFGDDIRVFDITEFEQYRRQDMSDNTCIFVATFASLRITDTDKRNVYASNEAFESHFAIIHDQDYMEHDEDCNVKHSFANILAFLRPLILVDEAHNNKSKLSEDTIRRLRPSAIIEFTATPDVKSNVLYKVSASELKTEDMIKLPIRLTETANFEDTISYAIQKRNALEKIAESDEKYIRPIVLFQAENKDKPYNVNYLKEYLVKEENIENKYLAIATGDEKGIEGVDLMVPSCDIRYIITVEALKEGWDCSFAYILCSVAKVQSSTAAEQFLGRIMRMPYVERRQNEDLNKAYAFVNGSAWHDSVQNIKDNLIAMGFDDKEAEKNVELAAELASKTEFHQTISFVTKKPLPSFEKIFWAKEPTIVKTADGKFEHTVTIDDKEDVKVILDLSQELPTEEDKEAVRNALAKVKDVPIVPKHDTPSERGIKFSVPLICLDFGDGEMAPIDHETFSSTGFNILKTSAELLNFSYDERAMTVEFDVKGNRLTEKLDQSKDVLNLFSSNWSIEELIYWLNTKVHETDVSYQDMSEFIQRALNYLENVKHLTLSQMVRLKYQIAEAISDKIAMNRQTAISEACEQLLFGETIDPRVHLASPIEFKIDYPVKSLYHGAYEFQKHFFPLIGDMSIPEEEACAKVLDNCPKVEFWVRNLERQPQYAFWIQTKTDKFYPDFVAQLTDGRILVVEHKGEDRYSNDDSIEKRRLGVAWAKMSYGKCLFIMTRLHDEAGRNIKQQIDDLIDK